MHTLRINAPGAKLFARLNNAHDGVRVTFWRAATDNAPHQVIESEKITDQPFHVVADHVHALLQGMV